MVKKLPEVLIGKILWVTWADVYKTAGIYSLVAISHYIFRGKFLAIAEKKELDNILKHDLWCEAEKCLEYGLVDELI